MAAQRILVIEDESGAREALQSLLVEEGYTVATADTGELGLERVRDFRPDTVVCDFYLPDTDGLQVLRQVRAGSGHDEITFIIITAGCGGEDAEDLLRREADFFLQKPVDLSRLRNVLQRHAGRARRGGPAAPIPN